MAAEVEGEADKAIGARLGRYGTAKARNHAMAGYLLQQADKRLSERLYRCAGYLNFREWLAHDNRVTLHRGHFCQVPLLCPVCAIRRGAKMLRRYVERADYISRTHDLWMVTLTVKNGEDLHERFTHLKHSLQRLRTRGRDGYGAFSAAAGALWSTEFTKSDKGWHPHVHMVWALPFGEEPIRWGEGSQLASDWKAVTGDSYIVHAVRIKAGENKQLVNAFCEVLKYALKFSTLSLADNLAAYRSLKGKRLLSSCGIWWGLELPEDAKLEDDPLDGPYIEHLYRYAGTVGYVLQDVNSGTLDSPTGGPTMAQKEAKNGHISQAVQIPQAHCHP